MPTVGTPIDGTLHYYTRTSGVRSTETNSLGFSLGIPYSTNADAGHTAAAVDFDGDGCSEGVVVGVFDLNGNSDGGIISATFRAGGQVQRSGLATRTELASFTDASLVDAFAGADHWGMALESAGDLDGDGKPEILLGTTVEKHRVPWLSATNDAYGGALYLITYEADQRVSSVRRIGPQMGGKGGLFPIGMLPHGGRSFGVFVSAADLDGDGLLEVAVGCQAFETPFDGTRVHSEYKAEFPNNFNRQDQGAVLMFTLGFSAAMSGSRNASSSLS